MRFYLISLRYKPANYEDASPGFYHTWFKREQYFAAIDFYKRAFGAVVPGGNTGPDGWTMAELSIEGARVVVADASPGHGNSAPEDLSGISVRIGLMVGNPDALPNALLLPALKQFIRCRSILRLSFRAFYRAVRASLGDGEAVEINFERSRSRP